MPRRSLAIVEITPERDTSPPPPKRPRPNPAGTAPPTTASAPAAGTATSAIGVDEPSTSTANADADAGITRILSWNVETPVSFLDLSGAANTSSAGARNPISSYYGPGTSTSTSQPTGPTKPRPNFLRSLLAKHRYPDFVCLQEVRARPTDRAWMDALRAAANGVAVSPRASGTGAGAPMPVDGGPAYTAYFALNKSLRGQRRFGVCTLCRCPDKVRAAREVDWDHEGRVHVLEMDRWALVNVYALNGSDSPWRDPLLEVQGHTSAAAAKALPTKTRNERKREFNMLLLGEVQRLRARGLPSVLIGDFNISLAAVDCHPRLRTQHAHALARHEFNAVFLPRSGLVDVFRHVWGQRRAYSWFARGKPVGSDAARVDYALVDWEIVREGRVSATGYGRKSEGESDHGVVWLELDLAGMARGEVGRDGDGVREAG